MESEFFRRLAENTTTECLYPYILKILLFGPTHGYILRKNIQEKFGFLPGTVTCYRVLYRLKAAGLVEKKVVGRKRVYAITQKGKSELEKAADLYRKTAKFLATN